jgi:hypothetical protein
MHLMLLTSRKKEILPSKRRVTSWSLSERNTWVYTRHTALRHILIRLCLISKLILVKEARLPQYAHTFSSCTIGHSGWKGSKLALYLGRPLIQLSAHRQDTLRFLLVSLAPSRQVTRYNSKISQDRFLQYTFQFNIRSSYYYSMLQSLSY